MRRQNDLNIPTRSSTTYTAFSPRMPHARLDTDQTQNIRLPMSHTSQTNNRPCEGRPDAIMNVPDTANNDPRYSRKPITFPFQPNAPFAAQIQSERVFLGAMESVFLMTMDQNYLSD